MIEFATFLLGLLTGTREVEVAVDPRVSSVELRLDHRAVAELTRAPFRKSVDFGPRLEPHLLEAIARDEGGRELGRVEQWVNRPRSRAAASLLVLPGEGGRGRVAELRYHNPLGQKPSRLTVTFDGVRLPVTDPRRIAIPEHRVESVHFLRAEVDFEDGVSAMADAYFGGPRRDEAGAELTAVPIRLEKGAHLPAPAAMGDWFGTREGEDGSDAEAARPCGERAIPVVSVEEGPAEVVVVLDESARLAVSRLYPRSAGRFGGSGWAPSGEEQRRSRARLGKEQVLRLLSPFPEYRYERSFSYQLFSETEDLTRKDGGLGHLIASLRWPQRPLSEQKLREAVSVAALSVTRRDRRRAVVLILGPEPRDRSQLSMENLRHYLRSVGVPLHVWSTVKRPAAPALSEPWGEAVDVSTFRRLEDAVDELVKSLDEQRIVWVEGKHLPQRVRPTACARGLARLS